MKNMKRCFSILLALVMAFALAATAMAETVTNKTDHSYDAYQIFSGSQADTETEGKLGVSDWGTGVNGSAILTALKADETFGTGDQNKFYNCTTAVDVAEKLSTASDAEAKAFAKIVDANRTSTMTPITANAESVDLTAGYYLLVDTTTVIGGHDAKNISLLQVTKKGNITIEKKYSVPSLDKSVMENSTSDYAESADWYIGANVPFRLTGTLPSNYADYDSYTYKFNDTLCDALQYNGDVAVYVENGAARTKIVSGLTVTPDVANTTGGGNIAVEFPNLKATGEGQVKGENDAAVTIDANSTIIVEYTAKLLNNAVIGPAGNKNEAELEFSNNPNNGGSGDKGKTPKDEVLVFIYEVDSTKVDGQDDKIKLAGAQFVLKDGNGANANIAKISSDGKFVEWVADNNIKNPDGTYPSDYTMTSAEGTGEFKVSGIDAGTYYLYETKAPTGYNKLNDPVKIEIISTLNREETTPALTKVELKVDGGDAIEGTNGVVSTNVENNSGSTLPETGGMGTTVLYIVGGVLVAVAAVMLIVKRRMAAEK